MKKIVASLLVLTCIIHNSVSAIWPDWANRSSRSSTESNVKPYRFIGKDGQVYEKYLQSGGAHGGRWMTRPVKVTPQEKKQLEEQQEKYNSKK